MADLIASGTNPGVEYQVTTGDPGVYHEDRVVVTTVAGTSTTQMFRVYGASLASAGWQFESGVSTAYATVQNPDGSIHYLTYSGASPWQTSEWLGSGNNAVYNAVDFGMSTAATDNTAALTAAIYAAAASGGQVRIPAGAYKFAGTIDLDTTLSENPFPGQSIIIAGYGSNTELVQTSDADLFSINAVSSGIRFQDLQMHYSNSPVPEKTRAAVRVTSSQNVTCSRVFFGDCPVAVYMDNMALQCGLFDCTIEYALGPDGATAVTMGGSENHVAHCIFRQGPEGNPPLADAPTDCTAISIGPHGGGAYVTNTQLSDFDYGIQIPGPNNTNLTHACISNVHCTNGIHAVWINPSGSPSGTTVFEVGFVNCVFERTPDSLQTTPGVFIDASESDNIADIFFANCMSHNWAGPGLEISGGQNISIMGGRFAANATSVATGGGISVTGAAQYVTIIGADCYGTIPKYMSEPSPPNPVQPYGISVTGAGAGVVAMRVRGCNLNGNASGALYAPTAGTDLEVSDCPGYNDQRTPLNGSDAPPLTAPLSASNCSTPYFGPSAVTFSGTESLSIYVTGLFTTMSFGDFYLSRPTDPVGFGGQPTVFGWVGK